jgi:hypothetical protein
MSASNWRICPNCARLASAKDRTKQQELLAVYGKVSQAKFETLFKECAKGPMQVGEANLREDYEVGVNLDGEFSILYTCYCEVCKFGFEYKRSENILTKMDEANRLEEQIDGEGSVDASV